MGHYLPNFFALTKASDVGIVDVQVRASVAKALPVLKGEESNPRPLGRIRHTLKQQKVNRGHHHPQKMLKMKVDPEKCMKQRVARQSVDKSVGHLCTIEADFTKLPGF